VTPTVDLRLGDSLEVMRTLPDSSVQLIATDPPYYKVKMGEAWDRQWSSPADYLAWMGRLCDEWRRVLAPNGSLYVFASPKMAARVECVVGERFEVLNSITWRKDEGWSKRQCKEELRIFFPASERIIFAEQFGADSAAKGESGYGAKCDELRGFVFEPLRSYLAGERDRAGFTTRRVAEAFQQKTGSRTVTGMAGHWFERVQWELPTAANYQWLRDLFNARGGDYLRREYDYLRREYDDLRREYDDLRRPFAVSADVPYTDVWDFPTVPARPGKHPCEKPLAMMEHIVQASSRPGDVVLDCFAGSGVTGEACRNLGRRGILIESDPRWVERCRERIGTTPGPLFARRRIDAELSKHPLLEASR
jgi:adenine-specific DNA-methyltransferase